jgi:hypothetical protein
MPPDIIPFYRPSPSPPPALIQAAGSVDIRLESATKY